MIKYIGSKRLLIPTILKIIRSLDEVNSVADFFSGTSRVGHALKRAGYQVFSNDYLTYAKTLAMCYVQADREKVMIDRASRLIAELNQLSGKPGYFTETFCIQSHFFQPSNGAKIDAIRDRIQSMALSPELEAVLLVSLMEAADRVDSTTGLQMAYLKSWASRSFNPLHLRLPKLLPRPAAGACRAYQLDAQKATTKISADLAYIDPPYNQHSYLGNYHIWESLVLWDHPEHYGVACKRLDCRSRKSDFNSRKKANAVFERFLSQVNCPFMLVSFNDEGYIARPKMENMLACHGDVYTVEIAHKRYVGAQIGIFNPDGQKVGKVGRLKNKEYLYILVPASYPWSFERISEALPGAAKVS